MRSFFLTAVLAACMVAVFPALSLAEKVEVYTIKEEGVSPMELRGKALAEGFARAVADEAQTLLGGKLDANRMEALRWYFVDHGKNYIRGYNILSSENLEDGLMMNLDVRVNVRTLRDGLTRMGLYRTVGELQPAAVSWPDGVSGEDLAALQSLMIMTGVRQSAGAYPAFTLEYGPEDTYKGTLVRKDGEWVYAGKDLAIVWTSLWNRYFARHEEAAAGPVRQRLTISGWFTPDGVLEFDRVLKGWDYAAEDSRLVEMDILPTGVGATWDMRILDSARLATLLNSFLPQRGLSFQLDRQAAR